MTASILWSALLIEVGPCNVVQRENFCDFVQHLREYRVYWRIWPAIQMGPLEGTSHNGAGQKASPYKLPS